MKITVKLSGALRRCRFKEEIRELPAGTRVRQVVAALDFPDHLLGIVLINGEHADGDAVLNDGDELHLLPVLDGG